MGEGEIAWISMLIWSSAFMRADGSYAPGPSPGREPIWEVTDNLPLSSTILGARVFVLAGIL